MHTAECCHYKWCQPNELIYETETDSQTQSTDWWLPKRGGGWGRDGLGVGISRCKLVYIEWVNSKVLL